MSEIKGPRSIMLIPGEGWTEVRKPNGELNYPAITAYRKRNYEAHCAPSVRVFDDFERQIQEYLEIHHPGEHVFVKVVRPHKKAHSKLWEWHFGHMKHGVSAVTWFKDKLREQFEYSSKDVKETVRNLTTVTVNQDEQGNIEMREDQT